MLHNIISWITTFNKEAKNFFIHKLESLARDGEIEPPLVYISSCYLYQRYSFCTENILSDNIFEINHEKHITDDNFISEISKLSYSNRVKISWSAFDIHRLKAAFLFYKNLTPSDYLRRIASDVRFGFCGSLTVNQIKEKLKQLKIKAKKINEQNDDLHYIGNEYLLYDVKKISLDVVKAIYKHRYGILFNDELSQKLSEKFTSYHEGKTTLNETRKEDPSQETFGPFFQNSRIQPSVYGKSNDQLRSLLHFHLHVVVNLLKRYQNITHIPRIDVSEEEYNFSQVKNSFSTASNSEVENLHFPDQELYDDNVFSIIQDYVDGNNILMMNTSFSDQIEESKIYNNDSSIHSFDSFQMNPVDETYVSQSYQEQDICQMRRHNNFTLNSSDSIINLKQLSRNQNMDLFTGSFLSNKNSPETDKTKLTQLQSFPFLTEGKDHFNAKNFYFLQRIPFKKFSTPLLTYSFFPLILAKKEKLFQKSIHHYQPLINLYFLICKFFFLFSEIQRRKNVFLNYLILGSMFSNYIRLNRMLKDFSRLTHYKTAVEHIISSSTYLIRDEKYNPFNDESTTYFHECDLHYDGNDPFDQCLSNEVNITSLPELTDGHLKKNESVSHVEIPYIDSSNHNDEEITRISTFEERKLVRKILLDVTNKRFKANSYFSISEIRKKIPSHHKLYYDDISLCMDELFMKKKFHRIDTEYGLLYKKRRRKK